MDFICVTTVRQRHHASARGHEDREQLKGVKEGRSLGLRGQSPSRIESVMYRFVWACPDYCTRVLFKNILCCDICEYVKGGFHK
jgi:hypothetical protein